MTGTVLEVSSPGGASLTLHEHEIARGVKMVKQQINSLRRIHPELKVIQEADGLPFAAVRIVYRGVLTDVSIDPLDVAKRLGLPAPDTLPEYMRDPDQDPNNPWSAA